MIRWPGKVKPGVVENGIFSGLDWFPTLVAAAGNPDITDQLLKGVKLGDRKYKNHLDGYNQMDVLLGKGPSARHELFYFGGPHLGALRAAKGRRTRQDGDRVSADASSGHLQPRGRKSQERGGHKEPRGTVGPAANAAGVSTGRRSGSAALIS
jgi:arylsulfatase A-like enzyme